MAKQKVCMKVVLEVFVETEETQEDKIMEGIAVDVFNVTEYDKSVKTDVRVTDFGVTDYELLVD
jgi:hypothetical protein